MNLSKQKFRLRLTNEYLNHCMNSVLTSYMPAYNKFAENMQCQSGIVTVGLGLAAIGFAGRYILKQMPKLSTKMNETLKGFPKIHPNSKYYKGGFESTMSKKEAYLILGVSPTASRVKIKEAHRRIMLLNHPDKGGSPYIASKINEAKDLIEKNKYQ